MFLFVCFNLGISYSLLHIWRVIGHIHNSWQVLLFSFSFNTLKMPSHSLVASMASDEKSAVNLIKDSLYMMSHCSHTAFKIPLLSLTVNNLIIMYLGMAFIVLTLCWVSFSFLEEQIHVFDQIQYVFSHFFKYSFYPTLSLLSFWGSDYATVGSLMVSHKS